MGNEMGNSNTTGLQEEENSTTQAKEGFLQEGGQGEGAERKNHTVPAYEVKDFNEVNGLASDSPGLNQKSNGREQEETEVHHPGEYAKVDGESNEAGDETSEIQQNFPHADSKEDKNPPGYINDGQANPSVHGAEGKDYKGKENGFTSDDLNGVVDLHVLDQIPDETGQEETEIDPLAESPKVEIKPNNKADGETSEVQETSPSKDTEDDAKRPSLVDDAEIENGIVPLAECQDNNERGINELAFSVPEGAEDPNVANKISDEREQEDKELDPPAESPKVEIKPNNKSDGVTSEVQETSPSKDIEDAAKPPSLVDDAEVENGIVPLAECQDNNERGINELAFSVPEGAEDPNVANKISDEREQEDKELDPPAESPEVEIEPNNKSDGETSEIQETSPFKDREDDAKPPSLVDDAEVENGIVPLAECQENNERGINELAFSVPEGAEDPHVANKISDEREQEDKELDPPAESPKVEIKPNNKSNGETSEVQETSPSKDIEDDAKPPSLVDDAEVENGIVPLAECQDNNERGINELAFSVPEGAEDPHVANKISDEREQENKELDPPAESPKVEIKPNNKSDGETSEVQETSPSKDIEDDAKPPSLVEDAEVENGIVPLPGCQDNNERRINELAFKVPEGAEDPHVANKMSDEREQEDKELDPPAESPEVEIEPNNKSDGETSEIQETSPFKDREDDAKPPSLVDNAEVENGIVPLAECQDNNERGINELAFSVPEGAEVPHVANKISDEREQEEKELDLPAESPKVEIKPNNKADGETNEIQEASPSKDTEDDVKPPSLVGETEVENGIVPLAECQANNERGINELAFNVPEGAEDPHVANKISNEREQKDKELDPPAEFQKVEVKSDDDTDGETSDIQPTIPSIDSTHVETLQESILEENLPQLSDHQLLNQDSIKKDIEGEKNATFDTISSSEDPEPQESVDSKFDQPELTTIHADPPAEDSNNVARSTEDILGSNLACNVEENCQHIDGNFPKDLVESVVPVSDSKLDKENDDLTVKEMASEAASFQERMKSNDRDEISNDLDQKEETTSELSSGVRINCNGDLPTEMNQSRSDSPEAEVEALTMDVSPNSHIEMSASADECILLTEQTVLATNESEDGETKADHHPTQPIEEPAEKCHIDKINVSLSEGMMIESKPEINEKRTADYASCVSRCNKDYSEEAKVVENDHPVDVHINNQSSMEPCKDSQKDNVVVPESRMVMEESSLTDFETKEVPEEKKIIEETEETTRASCISEIKQEGLHNKSFVTEASSFDPTNLMKETLVSVDQLVTEKSEQDLSQYTPETTATIEESNTRANHFIGQGEKVETPAFASDESEAQECMERLSTESNSTASNSQAQMRKSPSFGLDLRIEARTEESHNSVEDFSTQTDVSLGNGIAYVDYGEDKHVYQAMPAEEKVITMERIDSDKSKTPFLGFLKEEEEAHLLATPQEKDSNNSAKTANKEFLNLPTKEVASTSPKSKEKRKPRSFLFANCVCCTTVIN